MKLRIKKLRKDAIIPTYAHSSDACVDIVGLDSYINEDYNYVEINTGLAIEIPEGYVGLIFPRSSISKTNHMLCNAVAVIDSNFRGEIRLRFRFDENKDHLSFIYGDRVAQMLIIPKIQLEFEEVEELSSSDRGLNGLGSTGR